MGRKNVKPSSSALEVEIEEKYPYPSNMSATSFVSINLSGEDDYSLWKTQLLCLIQSHDMYGFIDGTFKNPKDHDNDNRSSKEKLVNEANYLSWRRSDTLVRGWIFGSLTRDVLKTVADIDTAKKVWKKLETTYGPRVPPKVNPSAKSASTTKKDLGEYMPLYRAAQESNWEKAEEFFKKDPEAITARLNKSGYRALHIAVGKGHEGIYFVNKLVEKTPKDVLPTLLTYKKHTALHIAAIVGNTRAVKILVSKNPNMLYDEDDDGLLPIHRALLNSHKHTFLYLLSITRANDVGPNPYQGQMGVTLLSNSISAGYYDIALDLVKRNSSLATTIPDDTNGDTPLMAIATKPDAFHSGTRYKFFETFIYSYVLMKEEKNCSRNTNQDDIENQANSSLADQVVMHQDDSILTGFFNYLNPVWHIRRIQKEKLVHHQACKLVKCLCEEIEKLNMQSAYSNHYINPIIEAAGNDAYEVVKEILRTFPQASWCTNRSGHYIIQLTILNRCEKVYNLMVYQMSEHKHFYRTVKDKSNNNILHLAGRLAPKHKLDLASGAALQMQCELQWFKEVEKIGNAKSKITKNSDNETPGMVFTREHKDLVKEGEEWMKKTADSYTITAALIITIVFAAAITVPGGNNGDTGQPIYTERSAFIIFAISDAMSLFTSTTSLLLFLSILTMRFAEQDFLYTLPTRLILGLLTLFLSTTFMMIAFSSTLYLMFGKGKAWILIPIASLACLPIASFVFLQFPLLRDLISSTYGRGIFGKLR